MKPRRSMSDAEFAAVAKRARRAAIYNLRPILPMIPSNRAGPEFARAEVRRMDRRLKKKENADRDTSAAAARNRIAAARGDRPEPRSQAERSGDKRKLSPVPDNFFGWPREQRRAWANQREIDRQIAEANALERRGVPRVVARSRFGSVGKRLLSGLLP